MHAEHYILIVAALIAAAVMWRLMRSDVNRAERRRMRRLKNELRAQLPGRKH